MLDGGRFGSAVMLRHVLCNARYVFSPAHPTHPPTNEPFAWLEPLLFHCRLTDEEITNNLLLLLFAGHDTSSVAMTQALANLHEVREAMEVRLPVWQHHVECKATVTTLVS